MTPACILCTGPTRTVRKLEQAVLAPALEQVAGKAIAAGALDCDYRLLRCDACQFEFADPMRPGNDTFYHWITGVPGYYPVQRWEWGAILARVGQAARSRPVRLLDVGCGSGDFLALAEALPGVSVTGIDTTLASVQACAARGFDAYHGDIDSFATAFPNRRFDFVTGFHCLEHVADPLRLLTSTAKLVDPQGEVLLSAPLSPMSFETMWFDPLNHPPHHLSRWSISALQALAQQAGLSVTIDHDPAPSLLSRSLRALALADRGLAPASKAAKLGIALRRPFTSLAELQRQSRRARIDGRTAGDIFLASFAPQAAPD